MEKNNKLIAEFMGYKIDYKTYSLPAIVGENKDDLICYIDTDKYHTDWNWLMLVVAKTWSISAELDGKYYEENEFYKRFYQLTIHNLHITATIEIVYGCVIEFIEWYNAQDHAN